MLNSYVKYLCLGVGLSVFLIPEAYAHRFSVDGAIDGVPRDMPESTISPAGSADALIDAAKLWNVGTKLTVCFMSGSDEAKAFVAQTVKEIDDLATGLSFDFGHAGAWNLCKTKAADIRVDFKPSGNWSYVGRDAEKIASGKATINFQVLSGAITPSNSAGKKGTVLHEFGHAIAMEHEHQSHEASCEKELNWDEVYADLGGPPNNWPKEKVDFNLRAMFGKAATKYDPKSIMHYEMPYAWFKDPAHAKCMQSGFNVLSPGDKVAIQKMYPNNKYEQGTYIKTLTTRLASVAEPMTNEEKLAVQTSFNDSLSEEHRSSQRVSLVKVDGNGKLVGDVGHDAVLGDGSTGSVTASGERSTAVGVVHGNVNTGDNTTTTHGDSISSSASNGGVSSASGRGSTTNINVNK